MSITVNGCFLRKSVWATAAVVFLRLAALGQAAADTQRQPAWGAGDTSIPSDQTYETSLPLPPAATVYTGAQSSSGGVGLRNLGTGGITVAGITKPVKAAYLYWAVITTGAAKKPNTQMKIQRLSPTPVSAVTTINGTLLGTGPSPCWAGDTISVFRGAVSTALATGNGLYQVTILPGAGGSTAGGDPWVGTPVLPLMEGASLVIVGTGPATSRVIVYDSGLAGVTFHGNPGLSYSLTLPVPSTGTLVQLDSIGADGQEGKSRTGEAGLGDEITTINGIHVAGPGSLFNDGDWNGEAGKPIPQLWDDIGHNITSAAPKGTTVLNISIANRGESAYDCLTPVANIVTEQ